MVSILSLQQFPNRSGSASQSYRHAVSLAPPLVEREESLSRSLDFFSQRENAQVQKTSEPNLEAHFEVQRLKEVVHNFVARI
jgi:hypothetical protein